MCTQKLNSQANYFCCWLSLLSNYGCKVWVNYSVIYHIRTLFITRAVHISKALKKSPQSQYTIQLINISVIATANGEKVSRNVSLCTDYMKLIIAALVIVISFIFLKFSNGMFYMAKSIKHFHRVEERTWKYCCRWSASSTNVRIEDRKDKVKNENRFSDS